MSKLKDFIAKAMNYQKRLHIVNKATQDVLCITGDELRSTVNAYTPYDKVVDVYNLTQLKGIVQTKTIVESQDDIKQQRNEMSKHDQKYALVVFGISILILGIYHALVMYFLSLWLLKKSNPAPRAEITLEFSGSESVSLIVNERALDKLVSKIGATHITQVPVHYERKLQDHEIDFLVAEKMVNSRIGIALLMGGVGAIAAWLLIPGPTEQSLLANTLAMYANIPKYLAISALSGFAAALATLPFAFLLIKPKDPRLGG